MKRTINSMMSHALKGGTPLLVVLFMLIFPLLTSCSSDDEEEMVTVTETPLEVMSYVTWFDEEIAKTRAVETKGASGTNGHWPLAVGAEGAERAVGADGASGAQGAATTRAWNPPSGYTQFGEEQKIGVALTQDGQDPMLGHFYKSSGKWRINFEIPAAATYYLYGYTPHETSYSCEVTDHDGLKANFSNGALLTIKNLPAITPNDVCVVIGAKNGKNDYKADADYSVTGLRRGDFAYAAQKATTADHSEGNYVYLLFDHLYAALRIRLRVDGDYNTIRTIKLKEVTLSTKAGETSTNRKTNITVKLNKTDDDGTIDPIESVTFTPQGEDEGASTMFQSDEGLLLETDYSEYISHFMPLGVTTLVLTSTFDVYDKHNNLIRKNSKATNKLVLNKLLSGQSTARRGCRYTINLTIKPTYLYQMSDPDLVNPSMVVE